MYSTSNRRRYFPSGFDVSTMYNDKYFDYTLDNGAYGIHINPSGTVLTLGVPYLNFDAEHIITLTMSTPWDISTCSATDQIPTDGDIGTNSISGVNYSDDGLTLFVGLSTAPEIYKYTLTTPYNISAYTYGGLVKDFSSEASDCIQFNFGISGKKLYVLSNIDKMIYQYSLSTPYDISTATYDSKSFDVSSEDTSPSGMFLCENGRDLLVTGVTSDKLNQYNLSSQWDISTAELVQSVTPSVAASSFADPYGVFVRPNNRNIYIVKGYVANHSYYWQSSLT